ncbi:MAG: RluA family pseudouridine synthase [Chloroflexi bacterium]|nr:MAG: RluA family pseudouridine synthase [Chloroflexota bacterium]
MVVSSKVPAQFKQVPIIEYLAARFTYLSVDEWRERVENGRLTHNTLPCTTNTIVTQGDIVTYHMPDPDKPPQLEYTVLYEDDWLLGINKPGTLLVHAKGRYVRENLIYQLRTYHNPPLPHVNLVNRLDKETSGVIMLAKDKETLRHMSRQFAIGDVTKTYLAIVHGTPSPASGTIDLPIGKVDAPSKGNHFGIDAVRGKTAVTHYETLHTCKIHHGEEISLLQLTPKTGRTHQLRVHTKALGHPIVGDKRYGIDDERIREENGRLLLERQALHCAATSFQHPHTGETCLIEAPMPDDIESFLQSAEC